MRSVRMRVALAGLAAVLPLLGVAPHAVTPSASASDLTCRAGMSDSTPKQYTNVDVRVRTTAHAKVKTVAHYRTTNTVKRATANSSGRASLRYYISGVSPGHRVRVDVTVTKNGRSKTCSTSFVPHR